MAKLFVYSRPSAFRSSNRQNSFIRTIKKKQSSEHIAALVTKLANAKVGLVAAGKPASEMFKKKKKKKATSRPNKNRLTYAVKLRNTSAFRRK